MKTLATLAIGTLAALALLGATADAQAGGFVYWSSGPTCAPAVVYQPQPTVVYSTGYAYAPTYSPYYAPTYYAPTYYTPAYYPSAYYAPSYYPSVRVVVPFRGFSHGGFRGGSHRGGHR